jgi:hypothetical protein
LDPKLEHEVQWVLRFYDVTAVDFRDAAAQHSFDIPVVLNARKWYVDLWTANRAYVVELGLCVEDRFSAICRSDSVRLPRADNPPRELPRWGLKAGPGTMHARTSSAQVTDSEWASAAAPPKPSAAERIMPVWPLPTAGAGGAFTPRTEASGPVALAHTADRGPTRAPDNPASASVAAAWGPAALVSGGGGELSPMGPEQLEPVAASPNTAAPAQAGSSRSVSLQGGSGSSPGAAWQRTRSANVEGDGERR